MQAGPSSHGQTSTVTPSKRRKASRACDPCRSRKLRCVYDDGEPKCETCKKSGAQCVSTQPAKIDKRRLRALVELAKTDEQKRWVANQVAERGIYVASTDKGAVRKARPSTAGDPMALIAQLPADLTNWISDVYGLSSKGADKSTEASSSSPTPEASQRGSEAAPNFKTTGVEPRHQGPSASINLLRDLPDHSAVAKHDQRYGLFRVADEWVYGGNTDEIMREGHLSEQQIRDDIKDKLISFYTTHVAAINPVIPPHRVMSTINGSSALQYSILGVASLWREVPSSIYVTIRARLQKELVNHIGQGSTLAQVRVMLISGMSHELHLGTNMEGGSTAWLRIGSAIRQAQDIGLHRLDIRHWLPEMYTDRLWVWLGCIVADSWYAAAYGQPLTINLLDCEDPLANVHLLRTADGTHEFQVQLYHFTCLLSKTLQTIFRPYALERTSDEILQTLLQDLDAQINLIPEDLQFHEQKASTHAGLLNLVIACVETLFFRSFVKMNRKLPSHLSFRPTPSRWNSVVERARSAIAWTDANGDILLDCWLPVKYMVTYCALAQYYHYVAERDYQSLQSLSLAKDVMNRWALGHRQTRPVISRSKIADIVNIFYKAAQDLTKEGFLYPSYEPLASVASVEEQEKEHSFETVSPAVNAKSAELKTGTVGNIDPISALSADDPTTLDDWLADLFRKQEGPLAGHAEDANTINRWSMA